MSLMFTTLIILNSFNFINMKTPLSLGFSLLMQTILISLTMSFSTFNYLYMYMLFLVMIGAMLILFIYMTSLSSNKKFKFNLKSSIIYLMIIFLILIIFYFLELKFLIYNNFMNFFYNYETENNFFLIMSIIKLYNMPNNQIMILLINYLLITLFIVVKIININMGPLNKNF